MSESDSALHLDGELLDRLALDVAVATEIATPPDLLPSRVVEPALQELQRSYVAYLKGQVRQGLLVERPEVLSARKTRGGARPVPVMTFHERVLLRALGSLISSQLPAGTPSKTAYDDMVQGPIAAESAWVLHGDVASFYSFVDHGVLEDEIVALTGDSVAAVATTDLLYRLMGRRFGLPQGHRASDVMADIYIDVAERQLLRQSRDVWRYNDDFRIGAVSQRDALLVEERLSTELRQIGLVLNDDKTFAQSRSQYLRWVQAAEEAIDQLAQDLETDLTGWNPYTDEEIEPDEEDVWAGASVVALTSWTERVEEPATGSQRLANRQVLRLALQILAAYARPDGLDFVHQVLLHEPQLTPYVARYLESLMSAAAREARQTLGRVVADETLYLNAWQNLWLLEAARSSDQLGESLIAWAQELLTSSDSPGPVVASSASLLAAYGRVDSQELLNVYGRVPKASRPEVVAALASVVGGVTAAQQRALRANFLDRAIFDHNVPEPEPF